MTSADDWKRLKANAKEKFDEFREISKDEVEFRIRRFNPLDMDMFDELVRVKHLVLPKSLRDNEDMVAAMHNKIMFTKEVKVTTECPHCHRDIETGETKWVECNKEILRHDKMLEGFNAMQGRV